MRIRVPGRQVRTGVDGTSILEHLEVKVIAGGTTGITFKADRLADANRGAVSCHEAVEMSVEEGSVAGIENAVRPETTTPTGRVEASDRTALGTVEDTVRHCDHESSQVGTRYQCRCADAPTACRHIPG